ncbi:MAG: SURF1 family protein [Rubrivivax sp.]|nr:MAG: SURF1 family protein [Rubrivivax sp.]
MSDDPGRRGPRSTTVLLLLAAVAALVFTGLAALGTWQVQRLFWKLDLIERVDQRVHAPATDAPGPAQWRQMDATTDEYRHVQVRGVFHHDRETLVQASTVLGSGFWVLTPLQRIDGSWLLINRGFVPPEARDRAVRASTEPAGQTTVTGLLRLPEPVPYGGVLRRNDPAAGRWFSRDVSGIAQARGLSGAVAPYFVDADAASSSSLRPSPDNGSSVWPVGGLTVVSFRNHHLVYAITWYALALMVAGAAWYVARAERRLRRQASPLA